MPGGDPVPQAKKVRLLLPPGPAPEPYGVPATTGRGVPSFVVVSMLTRFAQCGTFRTGCQSVVLERSCLLCSASLLAAVAVETAHPG